MKGYQNIITKMSKANRFKMNSSIFRKKALDETVCPNCGLLMRPQYENNGFDEPDPTKWEVTGFKCSNCGHKKD